MNKQKSSGTSGGCVTASLIWLLIYLPTRKDQEAFGWSFQEWGDVYSDTKDSGVASGFSAEAAHRPAAPLVVLFATDLEAARERVIKAGGKIAKEIVSFPGGRRFQYTDPAGNQLGVWSDK